MKRRLCIAVALVVFGASCGGSEPSTVIERQASADGGDPPLSSLCEQVETLSLGAPVGDDLDAVIDELGRLAAVFGANDALPHLAAWRAAIAEGSSAAEAMDATADIVDAATFAECGVPAFTAMYVSTSFASCFGRAPIDAGGLSPDTDGCETDHTPAFLPCFSETDGYMPVDCRTGAVVVLDGGVWVDADDATG
ncbi:MAG: hypothetical protein AAGA90_08585 [Actinomycetota bacterium]